MRSKDQILLENAYEQVLNEKGFLPAALALGMGLGGMGEVKAKETPYSDMDRIGYSQEVSPDGAVEEVMNIISDTNFPIGKTTEKGDPINFLPENLVKKDILLKASNSRNLEIVQRLTDLIQLKGYKVPPFFKNYRILKPSGV